MYFFHFYLISFDTLLTNMDMELFARTIHKKTVKIGMKNPRITDGEARPPSMHLFGLGAGRAACSSRESSKVGVCPYSLDFNICVTVLVNFVACVN